jgi:hypothetical protein
MCQDYDQIDLARFQSLTVDGIKDSVVIESLQKGIIKFEPFPKG